MFSVERIGESLMVVSAQQVLAKTGFMVNPAIRRQAPGAVDHAQVKQQRVRPAIRRQAPGAVPCLKFRCHFNLAYVRQRKQRSST